MQLNKNAVVAGVAAGVGAVSASANAALDPAVAAAFTTLNTSFTDLITAAYPVMIAISVGLVIFGLVKMFIHKAAGR